MESIPEVTRDTAVKVASVVRKGLSHGLGNPTPGHMCVEAAVCFAMGLPHDDYPPCVDGDVRLFKINLNDQHWESPKARARGLIRVAIAQLGSEHIDGLKFLRFTAVGVVNGALPLALRKAARNTEISKDIRAELISYADKFERVKTQAQAEKALEGFPERVWDIRDSFPVHSTGGLFYIAEAAEQLQSLFNSESPSSDRLGVAIDYLAKSYESPKDRDKIRRYAAEAAVQALIKLRSKGSKWLDTVPAFKG